MSERLQPAPELALGPPHPLGNGAKLAPVRAEQHNDPVGLAERVPAQHNPLIAPESHVLTLRDGRR